MFFSLESNGNFFKRFFLSLNKKWIILIENQESATKPKEYKITPGSAPRENCFDTEHSSLFFSADFFLKKNIFSSIMYGQSASCFVGLNVGIFPCYFKLSISLTLPWPQRHLIKAWKWHDYTSVGFRKMSQIKGKADAAGSMVSEQLQWSRCERVRSWDKGERSLGPCQVSGVSHVQLLAWLR